MDPRQQETLVQRLVANPHDHAAITEAHAAGQSDPEGYARLLEKVGLGSPDPTFAAHWLNEAASVWLTTFNDPERAASVLMSAVERDPVADGPALRLIQLYRSNGEHRAVMSAYERRATALAHRARQDVALRSKAAQLYEEIGRLYAEPPISDPARSRDSLAKAVALDSSNQLAIYTLREAYKAAGEAAHALPYFPLEQALEQNPARKLALFRDEAEVAKVAGDRPRAFAAYRQARGLDPSDATLKAQAASVVLETYRTGLKPSLEERAEAGRLFVELSEAYPGEHGFLYSLCALELLAADDRAMQLALYYGEQLSRLPEVASLAAGYVTANPSGVMAEQAKVVAGDARPPLPPPPPAVAVPARPVLTSDSALSRAASGSVVARHPEVAARAFATESSVVAQAPAAESLDELLDQADAMARKSRKNEAITLYRRVLTIEPTHSEALEYLMEQLPLKRKFAELREVLQHAVASPEAGDAERVGWLRELSDLCENQLRDYDGAVNALRQLVRIEPDAEGAADHLRRLLERAGRWDELAELLTNEATRIEDQEARLLLERNLAKLHLNQRKDPVSAGMAWARIAQLAAGDEDAVNEAVRLFESAGRSDLAAHAIATNVTAVTDSAAKRELYLKLGQLQAGSGHVLEAAEALSEGATALDDQEMWEKAEMHFVAGESWEQAANAADEQARLAVAKPRQAELMARAASYFERTFEAEEAVARLERAVELVPAEESYAATLERLLLGIGRVGELATLFISRAEKLDDVAVRVGLRKRAAKVQEGHLSDSAGARATYIQVLRDGEDADALLWLADEASLRQDLEAAADYLSRLVKVTQPSERAPHLMREGQLRVRGLSDVEGALGRFRQVLTDVDPNHVEALGEIADLEERRENYREAVTVLERLFAAVETREAKLELALRLADLYEHKLSLPKDAARHLRFVHDADPDDLDATGRLCHLAEQNGEWSLVAELMVELIAVEGEEEDVSRMTRRLAEILNDKLNHGDEALNVLGAVADEGDEPCRQAFIALGDRLGETSVVARRVVAWYLEQPPSAERTQVLISAFERFANAVQDAEAIAVGKALAKELAATEASPAWVPKLESVAVRAKDLSGLAVAHVLQVERLSLKEQAAEFVRQAEVQHSLGVSLDAAMQHGEQGLLDLDPSVAEPLLARLAALASDPELKVDVYERHVPRCEAAEERVVALCRAAEVAAKLEVTERAENLFESALVGSVPEEVIEQISELVRAADVKSEKTTLRQVLARALANGGQAARDGGKTQSRMLCRAAELAMTELGEPSRALTWAGDALVQYVDETTLGLLQSFAERRNDFAAAESVVSRALEEVFDGPMVRQLLAYRADLRRTRLGNVAGAALDLKQLHELLPGDSEVATRLAAVYEELGDFRGLIQLFEGQIPRIREATQRTDLARRIALLWQDKINDPREAADAWRRVLRLSTGDEEAKQGLARAKEAMLHLNRALQEAEAEATSVAVAAVAAADRVAALAVPVSPVVESEAEPEPALSNGAAHESTAEAATVDAGDIGPDSFDLDADDELEWDDETPVPGGEQLT